MPPIERAWRILMMVAALLALGVAARFADHAAGPPVSAKGCQLDGACS